MKRFCLLARTLDNRRLLALNAQQKRHTQGMSFLLVDDQGISAKAEGVAYGSHDPLGFSSLRHKQNKRHTQGMSFLLVDDQGLEPWAH